MKTIDVCLTPRLIPDFVLEDKVVVVVDVLRATSCMVTALAHGIGHIIPVSTLEEAAELGRLGHLAAAERDGRMAEGFDLGNSPFGFQNEDFKGRTLAMTTTNGTKSIVLSKHAHRVVAGAFLNLTAVANYIRRAGHDVVVVCAGWRDMVNAEDTLFAGALAEALKDEFAAANDATKLARSLYNCAKEDMKEYLRDTSHFNRMMRLDLERDIDFCLTSDVYDVVPELNSDGFLMAAQS